MKKITLLLILFVSFLNAQTTEIEYNYLTKGYAETVSKGLDLKQGYELQDFYTFNDSLYSFNFKLFVELKTKKTKGVLVTAVSKFWGNKYYLCIPQDSPVLLNKYSEYLQTWDKDILKAYSVALTDILGMSFQTY